MTDDPRIASRNSPDNQRYRNPNPRPSGGPCPTCNAIRPGGWKGPCRHCLDARAPRTAAVRRAATTAPSGGRTEAVRQASHHKETSTQ